MNKRNKELFKMFLQNNVKTKDSINMNKWLTEAELQEFDTGKRCFRLPAFKARDNKQHIFNY